MPARHRPFPHPPSPLSRPPPPDARGNPLTFVSAPTASRRSRSRSREQRRDRDRERDRSRDRSRDRRSATPPPFTAADYARLRPLPGRAFKPTAPSRWNEAPAGWEAGMPVTAAGSGAGGGAGSGGGGGEAGSIQLRHARRLFIGGLEDGTSEAEVRALFTDIARLSMLKPLAPEVNPVLSVFCSEKKFAFVELYSLELAAALLALNGMSWRGGAPMRVCRPSDYRAEAVPLEARGRVEPCDFSRAAARLPLALPPPGGVDGEGARGGGGGGGGDFAGASAPPPRAPGGALAVPPDLLSDPSSAIGRRGDPNNPNRIFVGNLPPALGEAKLLELFSVFGPVKALLIHKGPDGTLKPFGHVEYVDPAVTDVAINALHQLEVGDRKINVTRAKAGPPGAGARGGAASLAQTAVVGSALAMAMALQQAGAAPGWAGGMPPAVAAAGYAAAIPAFAGGAPLLPPPPQQQQPQQGGRVVVLENMVTPADLASDAAFRELSDDVKTECALGPRGVPSFPQATNLPRSTPQNPSQAPPTARLRT